MISHLIHMSLEAFLDEVWSKKHSTWTTSFIEKITFNKQELFKLIQENKVDPLDLALISRDNLRINTFSEKSIKSDPLQSVLKKVQSGYTLRIRHLDKYNRFLEELKTKLVTIFEESININCYYSQKEATGILPHYDPHHIFAIQIDGEKTWCLGDMETNYPRPDFTPNQFQDDMNISSTLYLTKGEVLYLPKGLRHYTKTRKESLHITIGIHQKDYLDWFKESLDKAMKIHPFLRTSLPFVVNNGVIGYQRVPHRAYVSLCEILEKELYNECTTKQSRDMDSLIKRASKS